MNTEQKQRAIAMIISGGVFALVPVAIMQMIGGWALVLTSGFKEFFFFAMFASFPFAFATYYFVRFFLAKHAGIKYLSPMARKLRSTVTRAQP